MMKNIIDVLGNYFLRLFSKRQDQKICVLVCKIEESNGEIQKYSNKKEIARRQH